MNTIRKQLLIGLTVLGLGAGAVHAQTPAPAPEGRHGHAVSAEQRAAHWAQRAERAALRQQKLHDALKLSGSQEAAWSTYQAAVAPKARGERPDRAGWKAMPAPARMEQRLAMAKQRVAAMETRLAALNRFYAVLTPEQQKVFDAHGGQHGGKHRMRHHRGHGAA